MTLLEECIQALGNSYEVFDDIRSLKLFDSFQDDFPFTSWGRIDWDQIENKQKIQNISQISNLFDSEECYIFWDEESLPVVKVSIEGVLNSIDDVTAVSFDTWILSTTNICVVEFFHEGEIMIGYR